MAEITLRQTIDGLRLMATIEEAYASIGGDNQFLRAAAARNLAALQSAINLLSRMEETND